MSVALPIDAEFSHYRLSTSLDDTQYVFDVRWNDRDGAWYFDLLDSAEDPIIRGVKIVLGVKLGRRCKDPRFPAGALIARDLSSAGQDATRDDLGTRVRVEYHTAADIAAIE